MTHYDTLDVSRTADPAEIRAAYLRLARRHHPDTNRAGDDGPAPDDDFVMRQLNEAWAVLGDNAMRRDYDRSLGPDPSRAQAGHATSRPWRPLSGEPDELDEDDVIDDVPYGAGSEIPRWVQLLPPGLVVLALFCLAVGFVTSITPLLALGITSGLLAIVAFLAAPFLAVMMSRRAEGRRR